MGFFAVVLIGLYVAILFVLSAFFVKRALASYLEYNFCGRNLSLAFVIFTYLGTWIGGGTIIGLAGQSYRSGMNQYWLFGISCLMGALFVVFFITRIRKLNFMSIGDFFSTRFPEYGGAIRIPVSAGILVRNVTVIGMQFTALSYMITYVIEIDRNLAVLLTFLIVTAYTSLSGLWGVVLTDVLQGFMQTIGMITLLVLSVRMNGGIKNIFEYYDQNQMLGNLSIANIDNAQISGVIFVLLLGMFFLIGDQGDWERIYSCKTDKTAFWGFLIPLTVTLLLLLFPAFIGVFQQSLVGSDLEPGYVIYSFIFEKLGKPLTVFLLLSLFSAILSSADSFMLASGIVFSHDIVKRFLNKEAQDKELIFWTKGGVMLAGAVGFAFAINLNDIIYLWIYGLSIASILLIPGYGFAWFSRRVNGKGAIAGAFVGLAYCAYLTFAGFTINLTGLFQGILLNVVVILVVSWSTEKPPDRVVETTYYWSKKFRNTRLLP
jgi:solute:Na+ symporter, SSS family